MKYRRLLWVDSYFCRVETTPTILPATLADAPALTELINRAYRGEAAGQSWTTEAHLFAGPRVRLEDVRMLAWRPNSKTTDELTSVLLKYVAANNLPIGCVHLHPRGRRLYLSMLAVAPEAQAHGVGRKLLAHAEAYARHHGCTRIKITVLDARPELLAWYERHGYQRTGKSEPFPNTLDFGQPQQPLTLLELAKAVAA